MMKRGVRSARTPAILTVDLGLTNCKLSAFAVDGALVAQATERYPTHEPTPDRSEQDPAQWLAALAACARQLADDPGLAGAEPIVLSITGHMHGLVALDDDLQPIGPCWTLFDRRAQGEAARLNAALGPQTAYATTGGRLEGYTPAAKIAWMRRHEPDLYARARLFVSPKDCLRVMLGGEPVTDPVDAAGTLLFGLEKCDWDDDILCACGIVRDRLPQVRPSAADGGYLSQDAGRLIGAPAGLPLVVGAGDDVEALGAGVVDPGQALEHIGTTGTALVCVDHPVYDPDQRVELYPHLFPGRYLLGGATNAAGRSLDWAAALLGAGASDRRLALTYPPVANVPPGPIYLPFISAERGLLWDSRATGALLGLRQSHGPREVARAVYEGVALSLKEILSAAGRLGACAREVISGTPLEQREWALLRADAYGLPLLFPHAGDLTGLGAAMLGMLNRVVYGSAQDAVAACCRVSTRVEPDPERSRRYEATLETYLACVRAVGPVFQRLDGG